MFVTAMDGENEALDLVNIDDQVIGTILRQEIPELLNGRPGLVRASAAFIVNGAGSVCVPRRSRTKRVLPGAYDFSVAEHVLRGESYESAVVRGFRNEAGLTITIAELRVIGRLKPIGNIPYVHTVYVYHGDTLPQFSTDEFDGYEWLAPATLRDRLIKGAAAKEFLLPAVALLMAYEQENHRV